MNWRSPKRAERFQKESPFNPEEIKASLAPLELNGTDHFIDFGCGCGHHLHEAAKVVQQAWGVDLSPHMVASAREFNKDLPNVVIDQFALQGLSICEGYFTKGFARDSLTFLQEDARHEFLMGISRGFAEGALFLLEDVILFPGWEQAIVDFKVGLPGISMPAFLVDPNPEARYDTIPFDSATLEGFFSCAGFQALSIESVCPGYGRALFQKVDATGCIGRREYIPRTRSID